MPASQAGRRGFDPRLPLHVFSALEVFESLSITAITALSRFRFLPDHLAEPGRRVLQHAPPQNLSPFTSINLGKSFLELPAPSLDNGCFQFHYRGELLLEACHCVLVFIHVYCVAHLRRACMGINADLF